MDKFIIAPKEDKSVTMTIRIDTALQERCNELICMALQYALDHMEIRDKP